jgi:steroid delta-isomerase-like uncharacterized protein
VGKFKTNCSKGDRKMNRKTLSILTLVVVILGLLLVACQPGQGGNVQNSDSTSGLTAEEEQNLATVRRFYEEFSAGNADVILEVHPETLTMHYAGEAEDVPTQLLRDDLAAIKEANPDLHAEIHSMVASGDIVMTELTWTATHTGPFFGIPATGETALHNGVVVRRLEDGKIVESWEMFDDLTFFNSIGLSPSWDDLLAQAAE